MIYYQDDHITIYHGDCREIAPTLGRFDLLLTDPPYGINLERQSLGGGGVAPHAHKTLHHGTTWDRKPARELFDVVIEMTDNQIIWGGNYFASMFPDKMRWLVWDKVNGGTDFADCELAWTSFDKAVRMFKWRWSGMLQENMGRKEEREHPTQKPIELMKWCIGLTPEPKTILDPFAGSGTTAVAAKALGLKCTLIEREERYCEIAAKRVAQETLPLTESFSRDIVVPIQTEVDYGTQAK